MIQRWPDFFVAGAERCGTTSIYHYLRQVPEIFMPITKEPCYFCPITHEPWRTRIAKEQEYLALFVNAQNNQLIGEASPTYLRAPESPRLIQESNPQAKIILILRDPVQRAFSHFLLQQSTNRETRTLAELIEIKQRAPDTMIGCLDSSFYSVGLKRFLEWFSITQIKVMIFEQFAANPVLGIAEVLTFLELDVPPPRHLMTHNAHTEPRGELGKLLLRSKLIHRIARHFPQSIRASVRNKIAAKPSPKPILPDDLNRGLVELFSGDTHLTLSILKDIWGLQTSSWYTSAQAH